MATTSKVLDLDAALALDDSPLITKEVKLLGLTLRIVCDINAFSMSNLSAPGAGTGEMMEFLKSMIHPEDWDSFAHIASSHPALRGEKAFENLTAVIKAVTEAASEHPTTRPSDLPRGGSTRSSRPKSTASSSRARAKA